MEAIKNLLTADHRIICRIVDVWHGLWRCTHAKLAPVTLHSLPGIATTGLRRDKGGKCVE